MSQRKIAVVLFNLGGPDKPASVRPFLVNLFTDPAILRVPFFVRPWLARIIAFARVKAATANYAMLGGKSPLLELTQQQARALEDALSDMDVRSLKTLYDPRGTATQPSSSFTVENFVMRVQALVADDRALIERLVRFAQAHDLLKKNAERAQKLAQESSNALETYQKQVNMLEERNLTMIAKQQAM